MAKQSEQKQLKIIPLGGAGMVNKNMFVYECGRDIIILDCGVDSPKPNSWEWMWFFLTFPTLKTSFPKFEV